MMPRVKLKVNNRIYENWSDVTINKSLDALYGEAVLSLTRNGLGGDNLIVPEVKKGDAAQVVIDGIQIIAGFVKSRTRRIEGDSYSFSITVRDRTDLLVDGSILNDPAEWKNQTALEILADICKPFGVRVSAEVDVGAPFEKLTARPGEKAGELIERVCRHRALLCRASAVGQLVLTTAEAARPMPTPIILGNSQSPGNALAENLSDGLEGRHHIYYCRTQAGDDYFGDDNTQILGQARDKGMPLYCPLVVVADEPGDGLSMQQLATTMAAVNAARSTSREYLVAGWFAADLVIWDINRTVRVKNLLDDFDADLLIKSVNFSLSDRVAPTALVSVVDRTAYSLIAEPQEEEGDLF